MSVGDKQQSQISPKKSDYGGDALYDSVGEIAVFVRRMGGLDMWEGPLGGDSGDMVGFSKPRRQSGGCIVGTIAYESACRHTPQVVNFGLLVVFIRKGLPAEGRTS